MFISLAALVLVEHDRAPLVDAVVVEWEGKEVPYCYWYWYCHYHYY